MKRKGKILALALLGILAFCPSQAFSSTAANTRIQNQATLSYDDGSGVQTINASVTVTVSLVPGLATLSSPANQTTPYAGADTRHTYAYTITAGGNGPDTYTLTAAVSGSPVNTVLTHPGSSTPTVGTASVTLGASVTIGGSTDTVLNVPSDGVAGDAVNGIAVGDTVVIGAEARTVAAVGNTGSGTATITLGSALGTPPAAGVPVLERQSFTLDVFSGTLVSAGVPIEVTVEVGAANGAGTQADQVTSFYTSGTALLTKFVRNVTHAPANAAGTGNRSFTVQGVNRTFYTGGVTARPGDTLEYLLLAENSGSGPATACTITDALPFDFVNFVSDPYGAPADVLYVDENGAETGLTENAGDDAATLAGGTLTVHVGTGATPVAGGTIDAGRDVRVLYRVTVK